MTAITQGRMIPNSDRERAAAQIREIIDKDVAPEMLKALADALISGKNGWIRQHLLIVNGRIQKSQLQTDFTKDLDARYAHSVETRPSTRE